MNQTYPSLIHRRSFLRRAAAATAAAAAPRLAVAERVDRPFRTALIGCGWWGNNILREAIASRECRIVGLCDVDRRALEATAARVREQCGDEPRLFKDYRELLQAERPDIAIVATPDHWHALPTIAAVEVGAHVYVEKPIGHTIGEGQAMVRAAHAADRVVQVGTHRRISPHNLSAREFIRSGRLGRLGMVRAFVLYGGGPERPRRNIEPPAWIDWDLWCGPAPMRPFNSEPDGSGGGIHPRGFRQYLDYANGTLGDWGVHWLDQILWITGERAPRTVMSIGGRPVKGPPVLTQTEQTSDAPDHQCAIFEFDSFTVSWEHRLFAGNNAEKGENVGCYFYGTEGTLHLGWRSGWTFYPSDPKKPEIREDARLNAPDHQNIRELWADFIAAIRERRRPVSDVREIHLATNMCLLAMISMKLRRSLRWDAEREVIENDPEANAMLRRDYRAPWRYPIV